MIELLFHGYYAVFAYVLFSLVFSLTFHEYGHAVTAYAFGDDTAKRAGRLTMNPLVHIDPMGFLMVVFIGFGYAKPVPINPYRFRSVWGNLFVSAAGPGMNLLLSIITINLYYYGLAQGWELFQTEASQFFFTYLARINLLLILFNLLPIGALDGHYILPYFLPADLARRYVIWNETYGNQVLFILVIASMLGLHIFSYLWKLGEILLTHLIIV